MSNKVLAWVQLGFDRGPVGVQSGSVKVTVGVRLRFVRRSFGVCLGSGGPRPKVGIQGFQGGQPGLVGRVHWGSGISGRVSSKGTAGFQWGYRKGPAGVRHGSCGLCKLSGTIFFIFLCT